MKLVKKSTIQQAGDSDGLSVRTVVPKEIREILEITKGDSFEWIITFEENKKYDIGINVIHKK